jgi:membrane fusion protein, multidrug efflux system
MKKNARTAIILIVVLTPAVYFILSRKGNTDRAGQPHAANGDQITEVSIHLVREGPIAERIVTVGSILSNEEVDVRSETSGKIVRIAFVEGGRVRKGDTLVAINDDELQARLLSSVYREKLAAQEETRQRQLYAKQLTSAQELDAATSNLNVVRADIALARAQIGKTVIQAPFDGVAGLRFVSNGSYVTPSTLITTIQDFHVVKVDFTVPEKYAGFIKRGHRITFEVQGGQFTGEVYAVAPRVDPATRSLRIRALSPNAAGLLLPGRFVSVVVQLPERRGLPVPSYAIIPELKRHKVFIMHNGEAEERIVEVGTRTDDFIEVTKGLTPGDTVITSALLQLRGGSQVRALTKKSDADRSRNPS